MTAIEEGQRVRSVHSGRVGTVEYIFQYLWSDNGRLLGPDAFALVKWDDGRTAAAGLAHLEPARALAGDPK